jgi:hypothetical protein
MKMQTDFHPVLEVEDMDKKEVQKVINLLHDVLSNHYTLEWLKNEERKGFDDSKAFDKRVQLQVWRKNMLEQLETSTSKKIKISFDLIG